MRSKYRPSVYHGKRPIHPQYKCLECLKRLKPEFEIVSCDSSGDPGGFEYGHWRYTGRFSFKAYGGFCTMNCATRWAIRKAKNLKLNVPRGTWEGEFNCP